MFRRWMKEFTYDYLNSSEENLWSLLYLTGYLTKAKDDEYSGTLPEETYALKIPNVEIREIFETTIKDGLRTVQKSGIENICLMQCGKEIAKKSLWK